MTANDSFAATGQAAERDRRLGAVFVALADTLVTDYDPVDLMHRLTDTCVDLLRCDAAALMLSDQSGKLRVAAASNEEIRLLELLELQNADGPCLECYESGVPVAVSQLAEAEVEARWPSFAPAARAAGFNSAQALPLRLRADTIGALSLLFTNQHAMTAGEVAIAQALADVATIGILQQRALRRSDRLAAQLQTALNNRLMVEQAKGMLAERGTLGIDDAFGVLREYSRYHRSLIAEVARRITTGELHPDLVLAHAGRSPGERHASKPAQPPPAPEPGR
ncbi:GAF and ANTAR domain-containing protein [Jatrophihabitans telluris]|uniref:GAF and ANTAR domain-containing protein n=1 Tax=Jatrophihabitans telluris TaxID=2038343 RepID=A0ABY4QUH6_9ACTN|nr:GAF and ANTAR domain-containing protein [Jatrophihabitans telluris]UQX86939.1 GAF and ANTAR domain-containing protein [Jatrophihabitans telluris]